MYIILLNGAGPKATVIKLYNNNSIMHAWYTGNETQIIFKHVYNDSHIT